MRFVLAVLAILLTGNSAPAATQAQILSLINANLGTATAITASQLTPILTDLANLTNNATSINSTITSTITTNVTASAVNTVLTDITAAGPVGLTAMNTLINNTIVAGDPAGISAITLRNILTQLTNNLFSLAKPGPSSALFSLQPYYSCTNNRYVSSGASGGGNGLTTASPWTIAQAASYSAPAGTCINLATGTYNETSTITISHGGTGASKTGNVVWRCSSMPFSFSGGVIQGEGSGCLISDQTAFSVIGIAANTAYVIFDALEIKGNFTQGGSSGNCIDNENSGANASKSHHIWVLNSDWHHCGQSGLQWNYTDWLFVIHNIWHNNATQNGVCGSGVSFFEAVGLTGYTPTSTNPDYWHSATTGNTYNHVLVYNVGYQNYNVNYSGTGTISNGSGGAGTILNMASVTRGSIEVGSFVNGTGVTGGTLVTAFGSGTGGAGTYTVNNSQNIGSETFSASCTDGEGIILDTYDWVQASGGCTNAGASGGTCPITGAALVMGNIMYGNGGEGLEVLNDKANGIAFKFDIINNTAYSNGWRNLQQTFASSLYSQSGQNINWWNNIGIGGTTGSACANSLTCSALDETGTASGNTWRNNLTYPANQRLFDSNNTYPTTGTNKNDDGTDPQLTTLNAIISTAAPGTNNFALQSTSPAIGFGQVFDLWPQSSGSIDSGACINQLVTCP